MDDFEGPAVWAFVFADEDVDPDGRGRDRGRGGEMGVDGGFGLGQEGVEVGGDALGEGEIFGGGWRGRIGAEGVVGDDDAEGLAEEDGGEGSDISVGGGEECHVWDFTGVRGP